MHELKKICLNSQPETSRSTHNQGAVVYTSVSIAFVTFTGIVIAAVVQRLQKTQFGKSLTHKLKVSHHQNQTRNEEEPTEQPTTPLVTAATFSIVEIDHNQPQQSMTSDSSDYRESVIELTEN